MAAEIRRPRRRPNGGVKVFTASMKDIEKALRKKRETDPRSKLPGRYHQFLGVFDPVRADNAE
jgi:hypothetical protein